MKSLTPFAAVIIAVGLLGCGETKSDQKGSKKLSVTAPTTAVSVTQGKTQTFDVSITRTGFNEPVTLTFSDLPDGVTIEESDKKLDKDKTKATFTLKATDKAPENGGAKAKVTATSGDLKPDPAEFTVKVVKP